MFSQFFVLRIFPLGSRLCIDHINHEFSTFFPVIFAEAKNSKLSQQRYVYMKTENLSDSLSVDLLGNLLNFTERTIP